MQRGVVDAMQWNKAGHLKEDLREGLKKEEEEDVLAQWAWGWSGGGS